MLSSRESGRAVPFPHRTSVVPVYVYWNTATSTADLAGRGLHHPALKTSASEEKLRRARFPPISPNSSPFCGAVPCASMGKMALPSYYLAGTTIPCCLSCAFCALKERKPNRKHFYKAELMIGIKGNLET